MFKTHRQFGRSFLIALAVCLIAVATITVYTFRDSLFASREPNPDESTPSVGVTTGTHLPVVEDVTGVPDSRTSGTTTTTTVTTTTTTPPTEPPHLFVLPVSNVVSVKFSRGPIYNTTMGDWRTHNGVDFVAEVGDKVVAIADGRVLSVAEDTLWGSLIRIQHGEMVATYCGVTPTAEIQADSQVKAGATLGTLTIVPCELLDGAHLHLELMSGQEYLDPLIVIDRDVKFQ